ncbi:hypothetical protein JCM33374_g6552 [Metschnikowia sp. JCM 33374]|nr:hypothetical protein JCM33374_g6552 [Metschnikowia sp. JCM 33374]
MFQARNLVNFNGSQIPRGSRVSIMTYNVLFRGGSNSNFSFKKTSLSEGRETIIMSEISHYEPDILCLQEVSRDGEFLPWKIRLEQIGYESLFFAHGRNQHGLAVAYKSGLFSELAHKCVGYRDQDMLNLIDPVTTNHSAVLVALKLKSIDRIGSSIGSKNGIIIGTTQLSPFQAASYERTRQAGILLNEVKSFSDGLGCGSSFNTVLAGDFNSTPNDAAYISLTSRPLKFNGITKKLLGNSICRNPKHEKFNFDPNIRIPSSLRTQALQKIAKIQNFHNKIGIRATSVYNLAHRWSLKNKVGAQFTEPKFSFWGSRWQGLVDYIFLIERCGAILDSTNETESDAGELSCANIISVLDTPTISDMKSIDSALPAIGKFPSDHLCLMAEAELL